MKSPSGGTGERTGCARESAEADRLGQVECHQPDGSGDGSAGAHTDGDMNHLTAVARALDDGRARRIRPCG